MNVCLGEDSILRRIWEVVGTVIGKVIDKNVTTFETSVIIIKQLSFRVKQFV